MTQQVGGRSVSDRGTEYRSPRCRRVLCLLLPQTKVGVGVGVRLVPHGLGRSGDDGTRAQGRRMGENLISFRKLGAQAVQRGHCLLPFSNAVVDPAIAAAPVLLLRPGVR